MIVKSVKGKRFHFLLMLIMQRELHMDVMALVDMACYALRTTTLLKHGKMEYAIFLIL